MQMYRVAVVLAAVFVAASACPGAEESKEDLKKKFEKRLEDVQKYKQAGKVGETCQGYLEALKEDYVKKDKKLKKLLEAENADRKKLYGIIAKEQSTEKEKVTAEDVGKQNVKIKFKKAGKDEYFKAKDGKWRKKSEMLKAKKKDEKKET
jgi:uncharacterized protein YdbL (DUF1318 family)